MRDASNAAHAVLQRRVYQPSKDNNDNTFHGARRGSTAVPHTNVQPRRTSLLPVPILRTCAKREDDHRGESASPPRVAFALESRVTSMSPIAGRRRRELPSLVPDLEFASLPAVSPALDFPAIRKGPIRPSSGLPDISCARALSVSTGDDRSSESTSPSSDTDTTYLIPRRVFPGIRRACASPVFGPRVVGIWERAVTSIYPGVPHLVAQPGVDFALYHQPECVGKTLHVAYDDPTDLETVVEDFKQSVEESAWELDVVGYTDRRLRVCRCIWIDGLRLTDCLERIVQNRSCGCTQVVDSKTPLYEQVVSLV